MKRGLCDKLKSIIGMEYAEKLITKLFENQEVQISKCKNKDNLPLLARQIVDILVNLISEELNNYIVSLEYKQEEYKEMESGNFVEFLLFNDFSQYMSLKNCMFLLDEKNYDSNFLNFRSQFKSLTGKKNDTFIKELNDEKKIFFELFSEYNKTIYEKTKDANNNLNTLQTFRGNDGNNLNKQYEAFKCINFGRDKDILIEKAKINAEN